MLKLQKGAKFEYIDGKNIIKSNSNSTSSGFYVSFKSFLNVTYILNINAKLQVGDRAFVYCESEGTRLISRKYMFEPVHSSKYSFKFDGTGYPISCGILFFNNNVLYLLHISEFIIKEGNNIIYDIKIINKCIKNVPNRRFLNE